MKRIMYCPLPIKKSFVLLTLAIFGSLSALWAQTAVATMEGAPKAPKWYVAANGGVGFAFMDASALRPQPVFGLGLGYELIPAVGLNLDVQRGRLSGGEDKPNQMYFTNDYVYGSLTARVFPSRFAKTNRDQLKYLNQIYVGTGLALIHSKSLPQRVADPAAGYIHNYTGSDFLVPVELGFFIPVLHIEERNETLEIQVNYRHNFSFTDKLDGYQPTVNANEKNDVFSQLTIGVAYRF